MRVKEYSGMSYGFPIDRDEISRFIIKRDSSSAKAGSE